MKNNDKIKPILFSTPMVQAILEGRKTQTRRIVKFKTAGANHTANYERAMISDSGDVFRFFQEEDWLGWFYEKPKYNTGDILWVRETWQTSYNYENDNWDYIYKSDGGYWIDDDGPMKWKPSIHMPKAAARIFLEVTNVRVERLFDISEKDAIAEGIIVIEPEEAYNSYDKGVGSYATARGSFFSLWSSINGQASTDANPWVFVYEFKRVERPDNF